MLLDLHFDPTSAASWRTTRWLDAVTHRRDGTLRLRPHSPLLAGDVDDPDELEPVHRALRVGERVREEHGDTCATRFYRELMRRIHDEGHHLLEDELDGLLIDVGLEPSLVAAALDPAWDDDIGIAMEEATDAGGTPSVPVAVLAPGSDGTALVGAVADPVPTGEEALALFDELVSDAGTGGRARIPASVGS